MRFAAMVIHDPLLLIGARYYYRKLRYPLRKLPAPLRFPELHEEYYEQFTTNYEEITRKLKERAEKLGMPKKRYKFLETPLEKLKITDIEVYEGAVDKDVKLAFTTASDDTRVLWIYRSSGYGDFIPLLAEYYPFTYREHTYNNPPANTLYLIAYRHMRALQ